MTSPSLPKLPALLLVKPVSSPQPPKSKPAMPPGVAPPPFPAICTWAATYCGSAAARNTTSTGINASPAPGPTADEPAANAVNGTTAAPASPDGGNALGQGRKLRQLV